MQWAPGSARWPLASALLPLRMQSSDSRQKSPTVFTFMALSFGACGVAGWVQEGRDVLVHAEAAGKHAGARDPYLRQLAGPVDACASACAKHDPTPQAHSQLELRRRSACPPHPS